MHRKCTIGSSKLGMGEGTMDEKDERGVEENEVHSCNGYGGRSCRIGSHEKVRL